MFGRRSLFVARKVGQIRWESSGPKAPFPSHVNNNSRKTVSFDKNMPYYSPPKAWERDGEDKEEWFKRKHAHHHVLQKPAREISNSRYEGIENKKRRVREEQIRERETYRQNLDKFRKQRSNPQIDYLFGTNAVLAALKGKKRSRFGKLYIHNPKDSQSANEILKLAKESKIPIRESTKQELNQLTDNAVHNGIVLSTRPMEILNVKTMLPEVSKNSYNVTVGSGLTGTETTEFELDSYGERYPFGIYLDEISDPHNVGAVLRSAYFLGVDFIVFSEKNCAPLSPVVAKASSGAIEFMDLFKVEKPLKFFEESSKNGWKFVSTVAPTDARDKNKHIDTESISELLETSPVILVIGSEGAGIRTNLINKSDYLVAVRNGREMNECVDSLNVSVATALLISKILK